MPPAKIVQLAYERGEFVQDVDGLVYWWNEGGAYSARHLRELADELDKINADWQARLDREFGKRN
jgi:hypothetical protein